MKFCRAAVPFHFTAIAHAHAHAHVIPPFSLLSRMSVERFPGIPALLTCFFDKWLGPLQFFDADPRRHLWTGLGPHRDPRLQNGRAGHHGGHWTRDDPKGSSRWNNRGCEVFRGQGQSCLIWELPVPD